MKPELIYLACPYSSTVRSDVLERVFKVNLAAAHLFKLGYFVFSTISHTHPIKDVSDLDGDFDFWAEYDYRMIDHCDRLVVLTLPGWQFSKGVAAEIRHASLLKKSVMYMNPITYKITDFA